MSEIIKKTCAFEDCNNEATVLACGRDYSDVRKGTYHPKPNYYCAKHAELVADEGSPEYHDVCPNCGCTFGVN